MKKRIFVEGNPNGDIKLNNKMYPYLYYECDSYFVQETNEGFIVEDKNAIDFLEEKLKILVLLEYLEIETLFRRFVK